MRLGYRKRASGSYAIRRKHLGTGQESQVAYYRKRYQELLEKLHIDHVSKHVLDQIAGVERELGRLGQRPWMIASASKKFLNQE